MLPSHTSVRRKPLPPDSPFSPPNSPRTSVITSQFLQTRSPKNPLVNPQPIAETSFIQDESIKTVSFGTSDAAQQETLGKSKVPPADSNYTYRPLLQLGDYSRMSEASFP